jgi:dATP pyrophosphohydrolase
VSLRPDLVECWVFRVRGGAGLEILLLRRSEGRIFPGLWQCVTGGIDPGERVPLAALREVAEETSFGRDEIEAFYDLDQIASFYDQGTDAIVSSAIFAARVRPDAAPALSAEHDAARWVSPEQARRLAIWPTYAESIARIRERLLDPVLATWFEVSFEGDRLRR